MAWHTGVKLAREVQGSGPHRQAEVTHKVKKLRSQDGCHWCQGDVTAFRDL